MFGTLKFITKKTLAKISGTQTMQEPNIFSFRTVDGNSVVRIFVVLSNAEFCRQKCCRIY